MENCDMSFVQATDLSRTFDLSDPFIVRAISRTPKRILTAVDKVSFSIEKGDHLCTCWEKVAQENLL
jgi:ABC-type oligopeptide transport system ATPase subunit